MIILINIKNGLLQYSEIKPLYRHLLSVLLIFKKNYLESRNIYKYINKYNKFINILN